MIDNLFILEPSDHLVSGQIPGEGGRHPINLHYKKPNIDGSIDFPDDYFDLIVCFATLHHIPNVTYVMSEMHRCLKKDGYVLLKEPIISMGDWRNPRPGLTKRERGIPYKYFKKTLPQLGFKIVRESPHFTLTPFLVRKTKKLLPKPIYSYRSYLLMDKFLSGLFKWNICYHPGNKFKRLAPAQILFVLTK